MKLNRYDLGKALIIIPCFLIQNLSQILTKEEYISFSFLEVFYMRIFGGGFSREKEQVLIMLGGLIFIVIFNFIFSTYMYKDLHISSIYRFSRNRNRIQWFMEKCLALGFYDFIYTIIYIVCVFFLARKLTGQMATSEDMIFVISSAVLIFMYIYLTTLLINILSISRGSNFAFGICYVLQIVLLQLAILHEKIPFISKSPLFLKLNPIANLICSWKVSTLLGSVLYFSAYIGILIVFSAIYISRIDLGLSNKEV